MSYSVKQLAGLADVSVRTLHYYDQIGLLKPRRTAKNGYRCYEEADLLTLQQILFFRELDFPVQEIKRIMSAPRFDMHAALRDQRALITLKKKRLDQLVKTIDKTLNHLNHQTPMNDNDLYGGFSAEEMERYAEEAKQRWGHTDAYKQSQERVKKMTKKDFARIGAEGDALIKALVSRMSDGATSPAVQALIAKHFNNLRHFYEPTLELYRGLAAMYVQDPRFTAYYEKYAKGLAQFMHDAMIAYCDKEEGKK